MVESNNTAAAAEPSLRRQETMTTIATVRDEILLSKKAVTELRAYANPPALVGQICQLLQAFVTDKKATKVTWGNSKNGVLKD